MDAQKTELHIERKFLLSTIISQDGFSIKYIFKTSQGDASYEASAFYRVEINRYDLCISTSAGCNLGCKICECTYSFPKFERHLYPNEIIDQIVLLLNDGSKYFDSSTMVLVVFMGNGDPLLNIDSVIQSVGVINNLYSHIITRYGLSTLGVNINSLKDLAALSKKEQIEIRVQFSTLSIEDRIRQSILPGAMLLNDVKRILDWYGCETGTAIRYNFPMISGVNNSLDHLNMIERFMSQNPDYRVVKLSSYNETSFSKFKACSDEQIIEAGNYLRKRGVNVELFFANRDKKIRGACGQLRCNKKISSYKNISILYASDNCIKICSNDSDN